MSQRRLFVAGVGAIAAGLLIGVVGFSIAGGLPMMDWRWTGGSQSISIDQAQRSVQSFLDRTGDSDLAIDELMEFDQNFYALIKEKSTGTGAFELLVDKSDGAVGLEPGPNMMWNTKYSMMGGGMMGGLRVAPSGVAMSVDSGEATRIAQSWLDQRFGGDSAGDADAFYGYYTFHFEKGGQIAGMLSVNGYSGQVWFHNWHGSFIQAKDFRA